MPVEVLVTVPDVEPRRLQSPGALPRGGRSLNARGETQRVAVDDLTDGGYFDRYYDRLGPPRATQMGLLSPREMLTGMWVVFGLAFLAGVYLVIAAACSLFGVIHSPVPGSPLVVPWNMPMTPRLARARAYPKTAPISLVKHPPCRRYFALSVACPTPT